MVFEVSKSLLIGYFYFLTELYYDNLSSHSKKWDLGIAAIDAAHSYRFPDLILEIVINVYS
jgi:hypothetical protein